MNKIEIYTSEVCPYCIKAKRLLKMLDLEYSEHNIEENFDEICEELSSKFGLNVSTVPQIIINDKYVGGYTDLESLHKSGKLKEFLE